VVEFQNKDEVTTIAHDYTERYAAVAVFLSGRDIASFVTEAKLAIERDLKLPEGYSVRWGGQFKNLKEHRGSWRSSSPHPRGHLPASLVTFENFKPALLVFSTIPLAMTGGIFSLALRGIPLSVSASVGFIALIGIAILNGWSW